jgi:hypothetical protein
MIIASILVMASEDGPVNAFIKGEKWTWMMIVYMAQKH